MRSFLIIILSLLVAVFNSLRAHTNLIQESGNLVDRTDNEITGMPKQWEDLGLGIIYTDPTPAEVDGFTTDVFIPLYNSSFELAATNALGYGYRLIQFLDSIVNRTYYILERDPNTQANNYWGTYVFNPDPDKGQLIIQSPHPSFDTFTGREGAHVFRQIGAAFFFMSGAHRCNSAVTSGCDGTSNVCNNNIGGIAPPANFLNDPGEFRKADVAHNAASLFQGLTEWLYDDNPTYYYFVQLHGFAQNLTPHAILSNGRDEGTPPPMTDLLITLRLQLGLWWDQLSGSQESLIIEVAHDDDDHNFNSLLATTNTQGRYINGSNNPCQSAANQNNGHFVHIEMAKKNNDYYLREEANFQIVGKALESTFLDAPLPVKLIEFNVEIVYERAVLTWKTASEIDNSHFEVQRSYYDASDFESIGYVAGANNSETILDYSLTDFDLDMRQKKNVYYRLKQIDFSGTYEYSVVRLLRVKPILPQTQKLLFNNHGSGKSIRMNVPFSIPPKSTVSLSIVCIQTGFRLNRDIKEEEIEDFLRETLPFCKPGVYVVSIGFNGSVFSDKFLRL